MIPPFSIGAASNDRESAGRDDRVVIAGDRGTARVATSAPFFLRWKRQSDRIYLRGARYSNVPRSICQLAGSSNEYSGSAPSYT
jgi:hypothetical protein